MIRATLSRGAPLPSAAMTSRAALALFVLSLGLTSQARADDREPSGDPFASDADPDSAGDIVRRSLVTNVHLLDLRLAVGASIDDLNGTGVRAGFHLAAGFDGFTNEVLGAHLRLISFDFVWNQGSGQTVFLPTFLRLDYLFFGAERGDICPAPFLTMWPTSHCDPESGYVGLGGSLLSFLHDTEASSISGRTRSAVRIIEAFAVFSFLPAFQTAFAERRLPISVGASLDYFWDLNDGLAGGSTDRWIGRALLAVDGLYRFAEFRGALEGRIAYRPSFTDWGGDYGIEASIRLLYQDFQTLYRRQGDSFRLVFEVGYAHYSSPQHSFATGFSSGLGWAGYAQDSGFVRVGFEPTVWNVP